MTIDQITFYHGTDEKAAAKIHQQGLKYGDGVLNSGVYISKSFKTALWFGNYLFEVKLKPKTRILDLSTEYNPKVIKYLKKEFGKDLIKGKPPHKIIPKNKHLTKSELLNLMKYFFHKSMNRPLEKQIKTKKVWKDMDSTLYSTYRGALIKHGYHGFGHPTNEIGFVIFDYSKIQKANLRLEVPWDMWVEEQDLSDLKTLEKRINDYSNLKSSNSRT